MLDSDKKQFAQLLHTMADLYGKPRLSKDALAMMWGDLVLYQIADVELAARMHRKDSERGRFMPTVADLEHQIRQAQKQTDGHPEPNEAWAVAIKLADESETTEYTDLIMACWSAVSELCQSDEVGARMAFLEMYKREVGILRGRAERAVWRMSFGHDPARREIGTQQARQLGRIGADQYLSIGTETLSIEHVQALAIEQKRAGVIDIRAKLAEAKAALTKVEKVDCEDLQRKQLADKKLKAAQMIAGANFNAR
jgi:hypothetical protein